MSLVQNTTSNSTTDIIDNEAASSKYLWLLFFDLLIFCSLTLTTYTSSKKINLDQESSDDFRPKFIRWLVLANGVRSLSLIFIIMFGNPNGNNGISWFNSLFHILPAFLFVSSYMYLAIFLADLYYGNIEYNNLLMKPALNVFVTGGYIVFIIIALITLFAKAYSAFFYISEFIMALLYLVLGSLTVYFGRKVSEIFDSKTQNKFDSSNEMSGKLSFLSYSIGGLFLLKGIIGVLTGLNIFDPTVSYPNIYDFFWFLILEIAPTVIFILVGRKKEGAANETPRQSSIYEMEYTNTSMNMDSSRQPSYRPPFTK